MIIMMMMMMMMLMMMVKIKTKNHTNTHPNTHTQTNKSKSLEITPNKIIHQIYEGRKEGNVLFYDARFMKGQKQLL